MASYESKRRLLSKRSRFPTKWFYLGSCYYCNAACYENDEQATRWERGDDYCRHELPNSVNRINRDEEEED
jgi:hypothetical protein